MPFKWTRGANGFNPHLFVTRDEYKRYEMKVKKQLVVPKRRFA